MEEAIRRYWFLPSSLYFLCSAGPDLVEELPSFLVSPTSRLMLVPADLLLATSGTGSGNRLVFTLSSCPLLLATWSD